MTLVFYLDNVVTGFVNPPSLTVETGEFNTKCIRLQLNGAILALLHNCTFFLCCLTALWVQ